LKLILENWKKYLKEAKLENEELLSQVEAGEYKPLTREVWETIQDEGYDEELELYNPEDFEHITLTIPPEDANALRAFSAEALEKYNRFDIELKDKFERHIDLIDYDEGIIRVVRAKELNERNYQKDSEAIKTHSKRKKKLVGKGKNKTKAAPFTKKASTKRAKSAPPGFGALSEKHREE